MKQTAVNKVSYDSAKCQNTEHHLLNIKITFFNYKTTSPHIYIYITWSPFFNKIGPWLVTYKHIEITTWVKTHHFYII